MLSSKEKKILIANWREEKEAAYLYSAVSAFYKGTDKERIFTKMAKTEEDHAALWMEELDKHGVKVSFRPRIKNFFFIFLIRLFGQGALHEILKRNEYAKIRMYFNQLGALSDEAAHDKVKDLFAIEKSHVSFLSFIKSGEAAPFDGCSWHKGSGSIRDIIFGMNDGLLSTFSLIAGLAGGSIGNRGLLLGAIAAAVAGAISMAAGAFVSTRAEREVLEKQLEIERKELALMPEVEHSELTHLYQSKGLSREDSEQIAETIMKDKDIALETMAREELGFAPNDIVNPFKAAFFSGTAFIVGAIIPILPVIFCTRERCLIMSSIFSFSGFFIIGAVRTIVTGKKPLISGLEMLFIGLFSAIITYFIGLFVGKMV